MRGVSTNQPESSVGGKTDDAERAGADGHSRVNAGGSEELKRAKENLLSTSHDFDVLSPMRRHPWITVGTGFGLGFMMSVSSQSRKAITEMSTFAVRSGFTISKWASRAFSLAMASRRAQGDALKAAEYAQRAADHAQQAQEVEEAAVKSTSTDPAAASGSVAL